MSIGRIVALCVTCAICCLILKSYRPELALVLAIAGGVVVISAVIGHLGEVFGAVKNIVAMTGLDDRTFSAVIKMIGIGYVTEFGASICEESGLKSLSDKIVLAGKIIVLSLSMPVITALVNLLLQVL